MTAPLPTGTILGYPRIGRRRELKKAVEAFWAGRIDAAALEATAADLRRGVRARLLELGLSGDAAIPDTFSYYDQVLDAIVATGALPERFADLAGADGRLSLAEYFAVARGTTDQPPLEMTKWFDSNYHYLVPEIGPDTAFAADPARLVAQFVEAKADGVITRPVLVGPVTLLALAKAEAGAAEGFRPLDRLADLVPVYADLLAALADAGAPWVQLDEPALVSESLPVDQEALTAATSLAYSHLGAAGHRPALLVTAGYGTLEAPLAPLAVSGVEAIAFDLVRGGVPGGLEPETVEALSGITLVGGVVDGRNIWRTDLLVALQRLDQLRKLSPRLAVGTSTSLQHVPHDVDDERALPEALVTRLAFADQKVREVAVLARGLVDGQDAIQSELQAESAARVAWAEAEGVRVATVRDRTAALTTADFDRLPFADRAPLQDERLGLPFLPTTTIGSFPQTAEIRRARAAFTRGTITEADYVREMRAEVDRVVALQTELGIDVFVHGEPERNDMVQYFAEALDGFAVTENGWVQSYGSRCTRPSLLWGDVSRPTPMTVEWSAYAASRTDKPMKAMLTGPVTILAWSFVRDDQPLAETANQVALALRDEIADLETAGIPVVQVDEPALRELLPLKLRDQPAYLDWSVGSFRLATAGAAPATQIHTHLCYSEFGQIIDAINGLDADVTSIEAARSRMEVVADIASAGFERGIGPGVYDIHSPRVPSVEEIEELLATALASIPGRRLWVNPDCGLKTRGYPETVASLANIVQATRQAREAASTPA